jgi:hypothetical protein
MVSDEEKRLGLPPNRYGPERGQRRWAGLELGRWAARMRGEKGQGRGAQMRGFVFI